MKRFAFALSLVAATAMATAPLAAQTRTNGPWWDPGRTQTQTQGRNGGTVYGNNGNVYGRNTQADGVWRADSRDRNGHTIYVRTRYDSNGHLVREYATRNIIGRYSVIDRQVLSNGNNRGTYGNRGTHDSGGTYGRRGNDSRRDDGDEDDGYSGRGNRNSNDRWDQSNGHDNGKHNGRYKNKNKSRDRDRDDRYNDR